MASLRLREATSPDDLAEVYRLFVAYAKSLGISLCFQNFEQELTALPGAYAPLADVWPCGSSKISLAK